MRLFIPVFLLLTQFALLWIYYRPFRVLLKKHALKVLLTASAVAVLLFVLFAAMSASTWRLY